jgi:deoxyribodipyrimidine photo-lyase
MSVIFWFRRDLRLQDNKGLEAAVNSGENVIPLFVFDPAILQSERISPPRLAFMLAALDALSTELHKHQRELLVQHGDPLTVLHDLIVQTGAIALYFNHDYTPYAVQRDKQISDSLDIPTHAYHDRLLIPPGELLKDDGDPYVVYTPFKKKWRKIPQKPAIAIDYETTAATLHDLDGIANDGIPTLDDLGYESAIAIPEASEKEAHSLLDEWVNGGLKNYDDNRNSLGNPHDAPRTGTSFLSPYIRFGIIATRTIYWTCREAYSKTNSDARKESINAFVDEIIWHEFYTHILWHFPKVKTRNFNDTYDALEWNVDDKLLQAWKDGQTGYPVVDAAMRQLKGTGWMHNRARMIVASFLTKDLLIDWREGEKHFMQWLLDGDLAANNGGWQWAAGTGTDAQPYFRIFNPVSQSKKFDPDGAFIRYWVPELRDVPDKYIHEPWKMTPPPADYPAPIVDHKQAREQTLAAYKTAREMKK